MRIEKNNSDILQQRPVYYRSDRCDFCKIKRVADKRTLGHKDKLKRCVDCYGIHQFTLLDENPQKIEALVRLRETYKNLFIEKIMKSKTSQQ